MYISDCLTQSIQWGCIHSWSGISLYRPFYRSLICHRCIPIWHSIAHQSFIHQPGKSCYTIVFVKDSILGNWPKYERRRREKNRARSASTSAEGARVRRRRKASAASLSPEAQEIPRSGIESLLLWPNSYRLQVTLPVKIGYAPSRRSTDLLPKLTQHAAI